MACHSGKLCLNIPAEFGSSQDNSRIYEYAPIKLSATEPMFFAQAQASEMRWLFRGTICF